YRRVDIKAQLANGADTVLAIALLRARLGKIANLLAEPAPSVELLEFNLSGPVLAVRPFCHNNHYWDVYFATNEAILQELTAAGFSSPEQVMIIRGELPKAPPLTT